MAARSRPWRAIRIINAASQKYVAISGGVQDADNSTDMTVNTGQLPVAASFPGRMNFTTFTPKPGRLDGWIIQFGHISSIGYQYLGLGAMRAGIRPTDHAPSHPGVAVVAARYALLRGRCRGYSARGLAFAGVRRDQHLNMLVGDHVVDVLLAPGAGVGDHHLRTIGDNTVWASPHAAVTESVDWGVVSRSPGQTAVDRRGRFAGVR